jgi:hypothetical protein
MAPVAAVADRGREVRQLLIGLDIGGDIFVDQADIARVDIVAGMLERDAASSRCGSGRSSGSAALRTNTMPGRPPIIEHVGEDVAVHEQGVGLAGEERAPTWRTCGESGTWSGRRRRRCRTGRTRTWPHRACRRGCRRLGPEPGLANAEDRLAVAAELALWVGIRDGRSVASQSGLTRLKSWIASSCAKP